MSIAERYQTLRENVPEHVRIVLACKTRSLTEVREVVEAGALDIAYNYVQEAETVFAGLESLSAGVRWHMIGHLQKNKINKAVPIFDMYQTLDSLETARALNNRLERFRDRVDVLMEVNSGREAGKAGLVPEYGPVAEFAAGLAELPRLCFRGLMTMGPWSDDAEDMRPAFKVTAELFECLVRDGHEIDTLSMGMSDSYMVAIEEGATMIRVGTTIFGPRPCRL
ncbi:MAG: YggS family pyridoxal phosphate-dependent enzyme [Deltaproteobacteria bacterium]|nr:YggS family pyridoxal phosphate-dependent enzyme [Deltaproteobacteria bacterium]